MKAVDPPDVDSADVRKARGAFYTSVEVCRHLSEWAIRGRSDCVLEPSCGEAAFMLSAVRRMTELGNRTPVIYGSEIHSGSARVAADLVQAAGGVAQITVEDFLARPASRTYDVVIGNPPYVRYQGLVGTARATALRAALREGVVLPQLANSWAPFVVHAAAHLRPSGRLALVVPAELLSAGFAGPVRAYLLRRFKTVRLVLSDTALFPGVLTDALLLMAEGEGPTNQIEVVRVHGNSRLSDETRSSVWTPSSSQQRWIPSLTSQSAREILDRLLSQEHFQTLGEWGRISLGAVTGNNKFFALTDARVRQLELPRSDLLRISPPGSGHLRSITFTESDYRRLRQSDKPIYLFRPRGVPSPGGRRYIEIGEAAAVQEAYKCRIRDPWWRTPLVPTPDIFVTYMNGDTARLAVNSSRVRHLNSVHGLYLSRETKDLAVPLAVASVNSVTLLGAEICGRSYGGGILKLEPGEARYLPIPSIDLVKRRAAQLLELVPSLRKAVRQDPIETVAETIDGILFTDQMTQSELVSLRLARNELASRRVNRGLSHTRDIC